MKYLAYGANMSSEIMRYRCKDARFLGVGMLEGYRLLFKGEEPLAYATIEQWDGYKVPYVLWELSADDETALDRFEGYPKTYQKDTVTIEHDGQQFLAMYYHKSAEESVGQPMTHYTEVLAAAYYRYSFDINILNEALRLSNDYYQLNN